MRSKEINDIFKNFIIGGNYMEKTIDLHGYTVDQAKYELLDMLKYADKTIWTIRVIHGYHGGTQIRDMVWRIKHSRIKNIVKGDLNPGVTLLELYH